eukprot:TRINITY_DN989_c1_g2_i5.p1 TRINITY_DN989_c1_g2~~TRINITY_DN989_c1_g2_i5.p1  ORF type:complete len:615 (-),score=246.54 TRINITY_DN989_c1_g2_i5:54-1898(-)
MTIRLIRIPLLIIQIAQIAHHSPSLPPFPSQNQGERNFHIFYQMCLAAPENERNDFQIMSADNYNYLYGMSGCISVDTIDDYQEYVDMRNAMNIIGISDQDQYNVFKLLSAILWLGNVDFYEQNDQAQVADMQTLDYVGYLLDVDSAFLAKAITIRIVESKRGGRVGTTYEVPLNYVQATAARDALAKQIYSNIFDWLVEKIDGALSATKGNATKSIGVLDIYGFEIFQMNGFEQLCINYVNEKLQQIFIELTLKQEQEEYVKEQIQWTPIKFFNNKIVCDLIESRSPPGIFSILDDTCKTAHADNEAADRSFMQRLGSVSSNQHIDLRGNGFCVRHYAGDVVYECIGMTDKNKDKIPNDLLDTVMLTSNPFLKGLFKGMEKGKTPTAGQKIKKGAQQLVDSLMRCQPHYIRCIKPNETKQPLDYDDKRFLHQIKYLGLLENIRVRRAGFAARQTFEKFLYRFYLLSRRTCYAGEYIWQGSMVQGVQCILEDNSIGNEQYQIGTSKVFIKDPETIWALEHLRDEYFPNMARKIQRCWRWYLRRKHEMATRIQRAWREFTNVKIYHDLKNYNQSLFVNNKQRRRMSMISYRRLFGDYLDVQNNALSKKGEGRGRV